MKRIFTFMLSLLLTMGLRAQTPTLAAGPTTVYDIYSLLKPEWFGEDNIYLSNNVYAYCTALLLGDTTQTLIAKGFGFSVPTIAVITGIKLEIEKSRDGLRDNVRDGSIRIVKGGNIVGSEHRSTLKWPKNDSVVSYGGSSDKWGMGWTPADINSPNFGISISARLATDLTTLEFLSTPILPVAKIDQVRMTVYYSTPLPIELLGFQADCEPEGARLNWSVATQSDNDYFSVERSTDGYSYQTVSTLKGGSTSNQAQSYTYLDEKTGSEVVYYRLKQTDFSGKDKHFDPISVSCKAENELEVYPNPAAGDVQVSYFNGDGAYNLSLYDARGNRVHYAENIGSDKFYLERSQLPDGLYILTVETPGHESVSKKLMLR